MVKREKNYGMGFEERHERRSNSRADVSSQCENYGNLLSHTFFDKKFVKATFFTYFHDFCFQ